MSESSFDKINISASKDKLDMHISKDNQLIELYISDYISYSEFTDRLDEIDVLGVGNLIPTCVLWNQEYMKVNKGHYFLASKNLKNYTVFINEELVIIDEFSYEEHYNKEKIIKVELQTGKYYYTFFKHDSFGSTYIEKIFSSDDDLSNYEDALDPDIDLLISNTKNIMQLDLVNISKDNVKVKRLYNEK